ncbi:isoaspartyl peptidase/L-asparaginase isoform X2 [Nothobranchius furzeri]|uniref:Isoaspartyl peptidase/L-asparaginase n=1 Tax=Nothobranchius furzeri TaxID=105023 RepID=A0A9D2YIG8_NOTFU|nr:transcript variant X2 [Nothobranchius furzeri]
MLPVVVVHGGAGHVPKERSEKATMGVSSAARSGYLVLQGGGSSMDAVVAAVSQLENNPLFNAGCGSVLNVKGEVEMDALVMDGKTLCSGAVSAVRNIANPVELARMVMDKTSHACLTAEGASMFARSMGVPEVPHESLVTEYSRMRWRKNLEPGADPVACQMGKMGTVGAVAVDVEGNVACATSTGGMMNKMEGRVGDTPCIGHSVEAASDMGLAYMKSRVDGLGGVVTVDPQGNWAARFSSLQMAWAAAQKDMLHYGLYVGEHWSQNIQEPHSPHHADI